MDTSITQTRLDGNGQPYNVRLPSSNVITADSLQPTTPINLNNTVVTPTDTGSGVVTGANSYAQDYQKAQDFANSQVKSDTQNQANSLQNIISSLGIQDANKSTDQLAAEDVSGVNKYSKDLADTNALILSKTAEYNKLNADLEAKAGGVTTSTLYGQQGAVNRQAASEIGLLQARTLGLQGQVQLAQSTANRAIDIKYHDIEAQIATRQNQLNAIKETLGKEDAKRASAMQYALDQQKQDLADKKANEKTVQSIALDAAKFGANQDVIKAITSSKDLQSALVAAKGYLTDPVEQAYKKAQTAALNAKTKQDIIDNQPVSTATKNVAISADAEDVLAGRNTLFNIRQTMGRSDKAAKYMLDLRNQIRTKDNQFDFVASDAGGKYVSSTYFQKAMSAIDSVMPNIDKIVDLSNQVSRVGVTGVDKLLQKGAIQIGNEKVSNFHQAQKLIADEIGVALGAGSVSDMKLQLGFDVTDPNVKPEVFASNMALVKEFIQNRKAGLNQQRYSSPAASTYGGVNLPSNTGTSGSSYGGITLPN